MSITLNACGDFSCARIYRTPSKVKKRMATNVLKQLKHMKTWQYQNQNGRLIRSDRTKLYEDFDDH